jgi:hypothetical protein
VSSKGNLHQYQNGKWSKLKLGVTNTVDLLATKKGGLVALAWEDDNSYLVHIGDGKELTRHTFNKRFFAAAELPNGNILLVGEGIHRFDGEDLVQEYDVPAKSVLVHNNIAYAGGSQVGLSGKASLFYRDSDGNWTTIKDPCLEDKDLVSLIVFRGDLYIANVLRLARLQSSGAVEIVREGLARYLGTVNDQLVICSMATASAFNGTEWTTIKE